MASDRFISVPDHVSIVSPVQPLPTPPKVFYGWVMLGIAILAQAASSPGQTYGVSIFNEPMRQSLGLSHSHLASAYMLGTLCASLPIAWFGGLMDRHGLRAMLMVGVTAFSLSCVLTACVNSWLTLFGAFFLLRLLGPGALSFLSGNTLSHWFHRRLGLVEGLRQLGSAVSLGLSPALNLWLVQTVGWRGAYVSLGVCVWGGENLGLTLEKWVGEIRSFRFE